MKPTLTFILLLTASQLLASNPFWIRKDKEIIQSLIEINKDSILQFEAYFSTEHEDKQMHKLGFGWELWTPMKYGGYIAITAQFYYYQGRLLACKITPDLPNKVSLKRKYVSWYQEYFNVSDNFNLLPYCYNFNMLSDPLTEYKGGISNHDFDPKIVALMAPTPNLTYMWTGGYANRMPDYRKVFGEFSGLLTFEETVYLTYSKNPITRLLAIEELFRYFVGRNQHDIVLIKWIEKCFSEIPIVTTSNGCIGEQEDTILLVLRFSRFDYW